MRLHSKEGRSERQKEPWILKMWQPLPAAVSSNEEKKLVKGFPGGAVVENLPANAGDTGSSPGLGRSHMPRSN